MTRLRASAGASDGYEAPSYDSARRQPPYLEEIHRLWEQREVLSQLVRRDLVTRYKRSVLGVAWSVLNPLGTMAILAVVFSNAFGMRSGYAAYVLSGLLAWQFFSQTTLAAMQQLRSGGTLIRRIALPRTVFAVATTSIGLLHLLISLVPLAAIMLVTGIPIRPAVLFLPVAIAGLVAFTLGTALSLSVLSIYFNDAAHVYGITLPALLYLTPIIYPQRILPGAVRPWLVDANPIYHLISTFRTPLYEGRLPDPASAAFALGFAAVVLVVGWLVFTSWADDLPALL